MAQRILLSVFILKVQPMTELKGLLSVEKHECKYTVTYITTEDEISEREIKFSTKQLPTTLPFKVG